MKTLSTITVFLSITLLSMAQSSPLDDYIQQGLTNNLTLKQNNLSLKQAEYALKAAKGLYLPEASINSRFSLAQGGRTIDFPIGDMLNPVYETLNQLLEENGNEGNFGSIENQQINFLRGQEYDASLSVVQPIYSRKITLNKRIAQEQLKMSSTELDLFKRELTYSIKEAYYNYLKTVQMMQLVERTKEVVEENHRITRKLFENDMTAKDAVLRAKADVSRVKLLETSLNKNRNLARNYFNFLINRDLKSEIIIETSAAIALNSTMDSLTENALKRREELSLIHSQTQLYSYMAGVNAAENLPEIVLAINAGLQGDESVSFQNNDYLMGSLVLNWTLFKGNINKNNRKQALIAKQQSKLQYQDASNQIRLEVEQDFLSMQEQQQNLIFADDRNNESSEVYRIVEKRYKQGETPLIELLDARNNMIEAESELINTEYNLLISLARLEKSTNTVLLP